MPRTIAMALILGLVACSSTSDAPAPTGNAPAASTTDPSKLVGDVWRSTSVSIAIATESFGSGNHNYLATRATMTNEQILATAALRKIPTPTDIIEDGQLYRLTVADADGSSATFLATTNNELYRPYVPGQPETLDVGTVDALIRLLSVAGEESVFIGAPEEPAPVIPKPTGTERWNLGACATPSGAQHVYTSESDTNDRLAGAWNLCTAENETGLLPPGAAGVFFTTGAMDFLVRDGEQLGRIDTWDYKRRVELWGGTEPGDWQITAFDSGNRFMPWHSQVSEDGRFLELAGYPAVKLRFVKATPAN